MSRVRFSVLLLASLICAGALACSSNDSPQAAPAAAQHADHADHAHHAAQAVAEAPSPAVLETSKAVAKAAVAPFRSPENIARNADRHPVETLAFFGLEDDMTVIEILPGGLWYTEVLAPVLREKGKLIAASFDMSAPGIVDYQKQAHELLLSRIAKEPGVFGKVGVAKLSPPDGIDLGPPGSADMVLTFRSTHGWINGGVADRVYSAFFEVLKPGGVLGVEQHRAGPKTNREAFSGYVPEETVIAIAEKAGFVLEARSEINANPKDTADHAAGVWTLPPTLRLGDRDREKYLAIGESDRMTLRFRKP